MNAHILSTYRIIAGNEHITVLLLFQAEVALHPLGVSTKELAIDPAGGGRAGVKGLFRGDQ